MGRTILSGVTSIVIVTSLAVPALANTVNGNANQGSQQRFMIIPPTGTTPPGGSEISITVTWTNTAVTTLFVQVFCGGLRYGLANAGFDRIATLTFGVPPELTCFAFVGTFGGATSFRMSVRGASTQLLIPNTVQPLTVVAQPPQADNVDALAQEVYRLMDLGNQ